MPLTKGEQQSLLARYEIWGAERVKTELERPDRFIFAHSEVTDFARAWLEGREKHRRASQWINLILLLVGLGLLGAAAVLGLVR